uniref:GH18 domain-containing protein n=1 Tax=Anopheles epiroticus TaxID=199890 RepID=A0A182PKD4_9DIPT
MTISWYDDHIALSDPDMADKEETWEKFSTLKRINPQQKLLMGVRSPLLRDIALKQDQRQSLAEKLLPYMEKLKLDGVELLWSGSDSDESFYLLLEELKSSFRAAGHPTWEVIVLIDVDRQAIDHVRLCRVVDFAHIMGASERVPQYGSKSSVQASASALFDIDDRKNLTLERALQYWKDNGCPADKMVLGVVFVAQVYTMNSLQERKYHKDYFSLCSLTCDRLFCSYIEMCQKLKKSQWTIGWDDAEGLAPHAIQGKWWVAYEDENSVGRKGAIARRHGLAGVYAFPLDLDDYRGKCGTLYPLTKSLRNSFKNDAAN